MQAFFNNIVELFEAICRSTGMQYSELNILVYCLLLPAFWCALVWIRSRKLGWLLLLLLGLTAVYLVEKQHLLPFSLHFYRQNILALERLGASTGLGYVGISLVMGVGIPLLFSLALLFLQKKLLPACYLCYLAINLGYYCRVFALAI